MSFHAIVAVNFPVDNFEWGMIKERRWCGETSFSNTGKHIVNVVISYKTHSATASASVFMRKTSLIYCLLFLSCAAIKMWGNK